MFDRSGHVIGVVVLKAGIDGVGFAVPPMSIARFLLKATRHDTKQGLLERTWVDAAMKNEIPGGLMRIEKDSVTLVDKQKRPVPDASPLGLQPRRPEAPGSARHRRLIGRVGSFTILQY